MTYEEAKQIIENKHLRACNLNEPRYDDTDEFVIRPQGDKWIVYVTDERAAKMPGTELEPIPK